MSRRETIGIGVDRAHLRIVCVRGAAVIWTLEAAHDPAEVTLGTAVRALLVRAPQARHGVRSAVVAIGPDLVQVRRLDGFPSVEDAPTRARILHEGTRRWFLMRPGGLLTAGPIVTSDGAEWGAAFERSAVEEVRAAAEIEGLVVLQVTPTVTILGESLEGDTVEWGAGTDAVVVRLQDGRFVGTARATTENSPDDRATPRPALAALGQDAEHLADALAAALLAERRQTAPFAIVSAHARDRAILPARARRALIAAGIATTVLLSAYPLALWRTNVSLKAALTEAREQLDANATLSLEIAHATEALDAIALRQLDRTSWISPLAALSEALPSGTAVITLRADSTAGIVVILGPRAGAIVDQIDSAAGFLSPTLVGPVTTEVVSGQVVERATIGFTLGDRRRGSR